MDQEWRRFHLLLVFMTIWNHAIGYPSLNSQVNPRSLRYHKAFSPRGLSGASMTKNIPLGVNSNVLAVESPSSSPFSQFGSASGTYESVSQTQSSPSGSDSASLALPQNLHKATLLQLQGSSSSNVQGMASQSAGGPGTYSQYDITLKDRTGLQAGGSDQLVSTQGGSASLNGLSSQSPSTSSQYSPVSFAYPSLGSLSMPVSGPSSVKTSQISFNSGSRCGSSQLATSSLSGLAQGASNHPVGSYVQSQSSPGQLAFGSSQHGSASTAAAHTTSSQYNPASAQSLSQSQIPQDWRPSAAQSMFSAASVPAPRKFVSSLGVPSRSAAASLYSSASMVSPQVASGQNSKTTDDVLSLSTQTSQRFQPSVLSSSQGAGTAQSQMRFSVPSPSDPRKSLASGGGLGQSAPASLYFSASMQSPQSGSSMHSQAAGSAHSLSQSPAPQRWQPSASLSSQGFQTSSSGVSQSSSPSQGAKFPSRFSMSSGSGPSQLVSTQGASSYSGLVQSLSSYAPGYSKPASSPLGVPSQFTSGQSQYASSSQSMAGSLVSASGRYPSAQTRGGSNIASLHPQVAAGKYAPVPLDVKVPVYSHLTSSGSSMSSNLQSQTWQPTASRRVYNKFPTSGAALDTLRGKAVPHQSSSRFPSVAGGTSRILSHSGGSYIGSSQSLGSDGQYTLASPPYAKFGASSLGVSRQSTSGQSSSSQYLPLSTTGAGGQPTSSSGYLSAQGESVSSVGSSLLSQGASAKEVLAPMDTSMSVASQTAPVSSGIQASGAAAFQSGSSLASSSLSSLQALSSPVDSVTQIASASSQVLPFGSMTQSSGSSVQAASGVSSASSQTQTLSESAGSGARVESQGMSGGSTSVLSGSYESSFGQSAPVSNPSHGYYGVKG